MLEKEQRKNVPGRRVTIANQGAAGQWRVLKYPVNIISNGLRLADKTSLRFFSQDNQPTHFYANEYVAPNTERIQASGDLVVCLFCFIYLLCFITYGFLFNS